MVFEVERNDALNVVAGIQPFDFSWHLGPHQSFEAPPLVCGFTEQGLGGASRILHRYQADEVLPQRHRDTLRPVLYNSWEATRFDVRVEEQITLARRAAELGIELFVVDDGWFGARDGEHAGLGDWVVNSRKFPRGLGELIDEVHRLGMQFGIWVEPEMVNPDSDLYRAHPDWVFHFEHRERTLARNQLVLNFAREDVQANILGQLQCLLRDHPIDFLKWDHNRPYTEVGWPAAPRERQREVWVRHVWGVYEVLAALRAEFPELLVESCAGGGGRVDLGILRLTDQVWVSDNTEASDRLFIQYGYSRAYAPRTMVNWVTDVPNDQTGRENPLDFRFHVAMQGVLGIGGNILRWTPAELAQARELVAQYKRLRPIVQHGDQYWLLPPALERPCAVQYVSEDQRESALFLYQARGALGQGVRQVRLQGLDPARRYRRAVDGIKSTGSALMAAGVPAALTGLHGHRSVTDWRSQVQLWEAVE
jgi:alpha-galactosidase